VRVVVADDSMLIREGLSALLTGAGCDVVATAEDGEGVLREVALARPDVVVVDIRMPPTHTQEGIAAAHRIRRDHPAVGVLVLSQYLESEYAMRLIADAPQHLGYLLKDRVSDVTEFVDALHRVVAGECVIDPAIVSRLMNRPGDTGPLDALTAREREVLALVAEGRSNGAIAQRLGMSQKTLEAHVRQILLKLDLPESHDDHRRVLAVLTYLRSVSRPA
jgi:DNA-binding NarL/FixJ family response regulator